MVSFLLFCQTPNSFSDEKFAYQSTVSLYFKVFILHKPAQSFLDFGQTFNLHYVPRQGVPHFCYLVCKELPHFVPFGPSLASFDAPK